MLIKHLVVNEFATAFVAAGQKLTYVNSFTYLCQITDNIIMILSI